PASFCCSGAHHKLSSSSRRTDQGIPMAQHAPSTHDLWSLAAKPNMPTRHHSSRHLRFAAILPGDCCGVIAEFHGVLLGQISTTNNHRDLILSHTALS